MSDLAHSIKRAVELIGGADALIVTAGAGMGVDSGLPDFRGGAGFWGAYPALGRAGLRFDEIACPQSFIDTPELAWGFYGHRLNLYRAIAPHHGFQMLLDMAARIPRGAFVFTSNVDGQFQKAKFDDSRIIECHGSIHHLQCLDECEGYIWPTIYFNPRIDEAECRILSDMPTCAHCRQLARPNILMFNDWNWLAHRKHKQQLRYRNWRTLVTSPVVIEIGAGNAIPSVRIFGEEQNCPLIRINSREADVDRPDDVSFPSSALLAIGAIFEALAASGFFERPVHPQESSEIGDFDFDDDRTWKRRVVDDEAEEL